MPTVNQSGLNTLMSTANNSAQSVSDSITNSGTNMCNAIGAVWACPLAQEFAGEVQEKVNYIVQNLRENMTAFQANVNSNTQRYNQMNKTDSTVPSVNYTDANVNTSGITAQLPDGSVGIIEGTSDSVVNELTKGFQEIQNTVTSAKNSIAASGAFDSDEAEAVSNMYDKLGKILTTSGQELDESVRNYIKATIEQYGEIKRTNINTSNNA